MAVGSGLWGSAGAAQPQRGTELWGMLRAGKKHCIPLLDWTWRGDLKEGGEEKESSKL